MNFGQFASRLQDIPSNSSERFVAEQFASLILEQSSSDLSALIYLCQRRWQEPYRIIEWRPQYDFNSVLSELRAPPNRISDPQRVAIEQLTISELFHLLNREADHIKEWLGEGGLRPSAIPFAENSTSEIWFGRLLVAPLARDETLIAALSLINPSHRNKKGIQLIQSVYTNVYRDLGAIAETITKAGVDAVAALTPQPGIPFKPETLKEWSDVESAWLDCGSQPLYVQPKYRGEQILVHIKDGSVTLFDRTLADVSAIFKDITHVVREWRVAQNVIFDCELVGFDRHSNQYLSDRFTRIARDHILYIFDLIHLDAASWINKPYSIRRDELNKMSVSLPVNARVQIAHDDLVLSLDELKRLYRYWVDEKNFEGIVVKLPFGRYRIGQRSKHKGRIKKYHTLDAVIVGYNTTLKGRISYLVALWNDAHSQLLPFRVIEGFSGSKKDADALFSRVVKSQRSERAKVVADGTLPLYWVDPIILVEIQFEGFKLRSQKYPQAVYTLAGGVTISRLRVDKPIDDADSISRLHELPESPKH